MSVVLKFALGEKPDIEKKCNQGSAIRYFKQHAGIVDSIEGLEDAKQIEGIKQISVVHGVGEKVTEITSSGSRMGFVIAQDKNAESAIAKCEKAMAENRCKYQINEREQRKLKNNMKIVIATPILYNPTSPFNHLFKDIIGGFLEDGNQIVRLVAVENEKETEFKYGFTGANIEYKLFKRKNSNHGNIYIQIYKRYLDKYSGSIGDITLEKCGCVIRGCIVFIILDC